MNTRTFDDRFSDRFFGASMCHLLVCGVTRVSIAAAKRGSANCAVLSNTSWFRFVPGA